MIKNFCNYIKDKNKDYVIFDIGSRDCEQSIEFYKTFPNAKIYAFECNPNTLQLCEKNIIPYKDRITLIKGAVCDYDGTITFYPINQEKSKNCWSDSNPGASSIFKFHDEYNMYHANKGEKYVQSQITTNCSRLDTIMKNNNISNVDIIWMDLQGAELLALKGLGNYLYNVKYIHTEVTNVNMYVNGCKTQEILEYTNKLFKNLTQINDKQKQQDIILINKSV